MNYYTQHGKLLYDLEHLFNRMSLCSQETFISVWFSFQKDKMASGNNGIYDMLRLDRFSRGIFK